MNRFLGIAITAALLFPGASSAQTAAIEETSPASEMVVVTINAHQNTPDTGRLTELVNALHTRPTTNDGRFFAPDVIVMHETPPGVLASMRDQLNVLFAAPTNYKIAGTEVDDSVKGKFLVNTGGVSLISSQTWNDVCDPTRKYQLINVSDNGSGSTLTVGGVHFRKNYVDDGGPVTCRETNATETRSRLASQGTDGSALGDFNRRPVEIERECDLEELSPALDWYTKMTAFSTTDGRSYIDTVRQYHRANNLSLADQWTQEWEATSAICDGSTGYRRNRIDYIFVSNQIRTIEAHVDAPGWADPVTPGATACSPAPSCKYSDHRFVWARIALPPAPPPPVAPPASPTGLIANAPSSTAIDLAWQNVNGETGFVIDRSSDGSTWATLATTLADTLSYTDGSVTENKTYYYRVSATNNGGSSVPSNVANVSTPGTAPTTTTDLRGTSGRNKVTLSWSAATDAGGSGLAGYEIWRSTSEPGIYTKITTTTATTYTNIKLSRATTYWYYVVAYDGAGNRGIASNRVGVRTS